MWKALLGPNLVMKVDRLGTYAAALAYCFVLSLVPFLAVTFVVGIVISSSLAINGYAQGYGQVLGNILPTENASDTQHILEAVQHQTRGGLLTVGFIIALYTSFNLMDQMSRTILFIFDDPRRPQLWSWTVMAKTICLLVLWMCLLLLISISAAEAAWLRDLLKHSNFSDWGKKLITVSQLAVVISALFGTFFLTYFLIPARRHKTRFVVEGSLMASLGWIACSLVFASVMPQLLKSSAAYIALGSVVAIMLWAQACAWSIILGACWIVRFSPNPRVK
jgi:YihY family inner membrane protein